MAQQVPNPAEILLGTVVGFWIQRSVWLAAHLKIADALAGGPLGADALAKKVGADAGSLDRVMKLLVSTGVFSSDAGGKYALAPVSELLRSDNPVSLRAFIDSVIGGEHYEGWGKFAEGVRTGKTAFDIAHGMNWVEYFKHNPEAGERFGKAMTSTTMMAEAQVLAAHDFGAFKLGIDVGGSHGSLIGRLLEKNRDARGVVFDLPATVEDGRKIWSNSPYADRLKAIGGDFFKEVPRGDLYLLKYILHDWTDEQALAILKTIRRAIEPDGRVAIIEGLMPATPTPSPVFGMDVNMLVMTGGRERTAAEYQAMLKQAGFTPGRVTEAGELLGVVEASA